MTELPAPPVPPDLDTSGLPYMPLNVTRWLTSDNWISLASEPRATHATVSLWLSSWSQVPAGSLPNNDLVLARLAMCATSEWKKVKSAALRSFALCSDGRWYHATVAEFALQANTRRSEGAKQKAKNAEKVRAWRAEQKQRDASGETHARNQTRNGYVTDPVTNRVTEPDSSIREGKGSASKGSEGNATAAPVTLDSRTREAIEVLGEIKSRFPESMHAVLWAYHPVEAWLAAGADRALILGVVDAGAAKMRAKQKTIQTLEYFGPAIAEEITNRRNGNVKQSGPVSKALGLAGAIAAAN